MIGEQRIWTANTLPAVRLRVVLGNTVLKLECIIQIEQYLTPRATWLSLRILLKDYGYPLSFIRHIDIAFLIQASD